MTEILQSNFEASVEALENSLKNAIFVAIDSEFSGIRSLGEKPSLFDSNEERYLKMKNHISDFIIIQYGLSAFQYDAATNKYSADVYNIYLYPRSMGLQDSGDVKFQLKAVEFLCRHGFDFNKMAREGVRYTNSYEETQLQANKAANTLLQSLRDDCEVDVQETLYLLCSRVSKWLATAKDGDEFLVMCPNTVQPFLLHYELRISFRNVWTESTYDAREILVVKISEAARTKLSAEVGMKALNEEAFQYLRGFSRVFSMLSSLGVPVVGHNMLLDLMMSSKQFHKDLPDTCEEFKTNINELLPSVYDTKLLCFEIKRKMSSGSSGQGRWESALSKIYAFLKSKEGESIAPNPPSITTSAYMQDSDPPDTHLTGQSLLNGGDASCVNGDRSDSSSPDCIEPIQVNGHDASSSECSVNGVQQTDERSSLAGAVNGTEECDSAEECDSSEECDCADGVKVAQQSAHFHEAGWDSFCAGFVFLRLAHINAHLERTDKSKDKPLASLTWTDLCTALKPYENRIHIAMGKNPELNLNGKDAASKRPPLLHVEAKGSKNLDIELLHAMFAKFGTIDIKPYSHKKAMLQAPTTGCALDILRGMKNNSVVEVEVYNPIRHSVAVRLMMLSGALLCFAGGFAILVYTGGQ